MSDYKFDVPSLQSPKGIFVIFTISIYKFVKRFLIFFAFIFIGTNKFFDKNFVISAFLVVLVIIILSILEYLNFKFYLNKDYFILKQGVLNKEETSISISKIQNVYIKQNLIQQLINVVSLSIETAGDSDTEIEIKALSRPKAEALKLVLVKATKLHSKPLNIEKKQDSVYFSISFKQLILEGITENHLNSFLVIIVFIGGIYNDFKDSIKNLGLEKKFGEWLLLDEKTVVTALMVNFILMLCLVIASFLFSLIKVIIVNHNLQVKLTNNGLEISKGLINKMSLNLISSRIQNITISTNLLKKKLNLHKLSFKQTMVDKKQQKHFAVIGLAKSQVKDLVSTFYPEVFTTLDKNKPERYFIRIQIVKALFFISLLNIPMLFAPKMVFFLNIPLVLFHAISVKHSYKKAYYSITDRYLKVGKGNLIETKTELLELHKIQSVELSQSLLQKARKIASLQIYSASKKVTIPFIKEGKAFSIYNYLLYKVESKEKDWM